MTFSNTLTHTTPLLSDYWYSPWRCMPFALACRVRFLNQLSVQSSGLDIILHKTASTSDYGGWGLCDSAMHSTWMLSRESEHATLKHKDMLMQQQNYCSC